MTNSLLLKTIALCVLSLTLLSRGASAGCFSGPRLVKDDAYKGYEFTNNCASGAKVYWRRTYRKDDGSQGSESDYWYVSSCSTETKQHFQGDYTFGSVDVDESMTCVAKDVKRPDVSSGNEASRHVGSNGTNRLSVDNLGERLQTQNAKNAGLREERFKADHDFDAAARDATSAYESAQAKARQARQEEADRQAHLEEAQRTQLDRVLAECEDGYQQDITICTNDTDQFYRNGLPAQWVHIDSSNCRTAADTRRWTCRSVARGSPDISFRRGVLADVEGRYRNFRNSDASIWSPVQAPQPSYQPPVQTYQSQPQQGQPQRQSPQAAPNSYSQRPAGGDSTTTSNFRGGSAYVPPPQPRFVAPSNAVH